MEKRKKVTPEMVKHWSVLYRQGLSTRKIAKEAGFGKTTVCKHLREAGLLRKKRFPSEEEIDEWVKDYDSGISPRILSQKVGFCEETIRTHLKIRGVTMRPVGGPLIHEHDNDSEWQSEYIAGSSIRDIAVKYGASETTVSSRLRAMGTLMRQGFETNRRVSKDLILNFIQEYAEGQSSVDIGKKYGFSSTTVLFYLKEAGVDTGSLVKEDDIVLISNRYQSGETSQSIADDYGISNQYVRMILKKNNVEIRDPERGISFSNNEIEGWVRRYNSGESLSSIAFAANVKSVDTIKDRLVKAGAKIRDKVGSSSSSWPEWAIFFYLSKAFPDAHVASNKGIETSKGMRFPDVSLEINDGSKIAIEYDGEFWHGDHEHKKMDEEKTRLLEEQGYRVIRVIENSNGDNNVQGSLIYCTTETIGNETGLGFAINAILQILGSKNIGVNLDKDSASISRLYYDAKNRTKHGIEWFNLYVDEGLSSNVIAEMYGTTATTVTTALKSLGASIRHRSTDNETINRWAQLVENGVPVQSIADESGVSKSTVYRALKRSGTEFDAHPIKPITPQDIEWKRLYLEDGISMSEIARRFSVSVGTVSNHLRKMGISSQRQ